MNIENNPAIEQFLKSCDQYAVLHEASVSKKNLENYFIAISILDTQDFSVREFLQKYQSIYPLLDISSSSKGYIEKNKHKYHFVFLDTLDKSDLFFAKKEEFLKKNVGNILSIRMLGQPVDLTGYIGSQADKYFTQFKSISESVIDVAKEEFKNGLAIGTKKFQEKAPLLKQKFESIKNKVIKPK